MTTRNEYQDEQRAKTPLVSDRVYKGLRRGVEYVMPAAITLYLAIASIWGLPYSDKIGASAAAFTVFLGVCVAATRKAYLESDVKYDGELVINEGEDRDLYSLEISKPIDAISGSDELVLRVVNPQK